jgi:hypothetical protein
MQVLKVISNTAAKIKPNYNEIYYKAFQRALSAGNLVQAIYYGVKYVITLDEPKNMDMARYKFSMIDIVNKGIAMLTPSELMQIFPVKKDFDGGKYGTKDYFFTMQELNKLGLDKRIGENVHDVLWDYQNNDIEMFLLAELMTASTIRKLEGHKGIVEEFAEQNDIKLYTLHEDADGHKYIYDKSTGKTAKVKRKMPRYIKLVKKNGGI